MPVLPQRPIRLVAALCSLVIALACLAIPLSGAFGEDRGDALTVGVPTDRCPIFYRDANTGEIVGIGVDLMRTAAEEAGYDVTFVVVGEPTLKEALDNPEYDVVMPFGSAIDSASGHATVVSDNLFQTPFTLVTTSNGEHPPLNELRVGMLRSLGGGAETVRELYPGIEITLYDTMGDCVRALRAGEVDALLHNSYVWSYVLQKPSYSDLEVQPSAMFSMDFRAGTLDTPEGRATIERLNGGIDSLTDTQRQAIALDYTSRKLYRYDLSDYLHEYWLVLLLGVLLVAALIAIVVLKVRAMRLKQKEEMRRLIDYDQLTGALSMNGFRKRAEELIRAHPGTQYMISYVNIKNFKFVNDSLGRESGDELLRFLVGKSMEILGDEEAIGRIGSDHFAVLSIGDSDERLRKSEELVFEPVRNYFIDRGKENRIQVCAGVYVLTLEDYKHVDIDRMLDFARVAEKRVRETRRDGYEFYNPNQWEKGKQVAEVVSRLPLAIRSGELMVWYQPQVNYETGEIIGAEALCRWDHGDLGWLRPSEFIPVLEETGLIYDLDSYIWDRVCQDLRRWNEEGLRLSISVNLSRCDIREDADIPEHFNNLVTAYGLTSDQLRIEVTETAFVEDPARLIDATTRLRELGFQVEMDDFGSGYSSLHMLKEVPVDRIKLDLHFLTSAGDPEKSRIIVSQVIQMVKLLGMNLIAEGVETEQQATFLHDHGCNELQGFYFYKPMAVEDFEEVIRQVQTPASES